MQHEEQNPFLESIHKFHQYGHTVADDGLAELKEIYEIEFKKVSFGPDDLKKMSDFAATNNGWANILIKNKKDAKPGEAGFYIELDTWVADGKPKKDLPF